MGKKSKKKKEPPAASVPSAVGSTIADSLGTIASWKCPENHGGCPDGWRVYLAIEGNLHDWIEAGKGFVWCDATAKSQMIKGAGAACLKIKRDIKRQLGEGGVSAIVAVLYACCARAILIDNTPLAHHFRDQILVMSGMFFQRNTDVGELSTERGMIRDVAKKIPCNCLDIKKDQVKKLPKASQCQGCEVEKPVNEMFLCGRCKITRYCSQKCQREDWKSVHKTVCQCLKQMTDNQQLDLGLQFQSDTAAICKPCRT